MKSFLTVCKKSLTYKLLLVMKLCIAFMLLFTLNVSAKGYGQKKITIKVSNAEIAKILSAIEKNSAYRFLYNNNLTALQQKTSLSVEDAEIKQVLETLFQNTGLSYQLMENNLIVVKEELFANPGAVQATVTGRVVSDSGNAMSGVSVQVKGTARGTTTDSDGKFSISAEGNETLVFSYVGYETQEVAISGKTEVNVTLKTGNSSLSEVVVVGYGTQKKTDLTAPVSVVNTDDLVKRTTATPMDALQGSVPGVQVVSSGAPGSSPTVRIRGVGSFNNENPLYVVDGMFLDNIDFLNPNDIADMSILKDASGAAIYGVRAANGVVIITTKKGKLNMKTRVTYNGYVGYQTPAHMLQMANGQQYAAMQLAKGTSTDSSRVTLSVSKFGGSGLNPSTNTDWYDELLRSKALIHNHSLDLSGGSDKITYTLGLNYLYQDGIMNADNNYKRYNIRLQTEAKAFPWLKVGFTVHMSNSTEFTPNTGAFANAYYASPLYPVYDATNTLATPIDFATSTSLGYNNGVYNNPVAAGYYNYNRIKGFQVLPTVYAEANILGNKLTFRTQLSQRYASNQTIKYIPDYYIDNNQRQPKSSLTSTQDRYTDFILDNLLTYKDAVGKHHWSVLLGQSTREQRWRQTWVSADSVPNVEQSWYVNQGIQSITGYGEDGTRNAGISYFARATYDYDGKYLLTATYRADGSSKYQTKWGYFPSVGLGWVVSREDFMKNQNIFDFLKLRGSWGKLGNDAINANPGYAVAYTGNDYSGIYSSTGTSNGNYVTGYRINRFFTPITWEVVEEWDGGIDFSLLKQKLTGSVDYYHRLTDHVAFNRPLPFTGVQLYGNWGKVENSGVELSLNWADKIGKLGYRIGGNISSLKNKVTDLSGLANLATGISEFPTRVQVGESINYFYGYQVTGVYQTQAEVDADPIAVANGVKPGYLKFKDQNGDKVLDANDRVNLGSYLPKITYGFNIGLDYGNFDLSVVFQGVSGNKILNLNRALRLKYSDMNGDEKFVSGLWTGTNSTNAYPSAYASTQGWSNQASSFFVESGSYLRVQNIQLGYNFKVGNGSNATRMRVYATADRPFIFTKYSGFTPEVTGAKTDVANTGYDSNIYPVSATYSVGVRITY